MKTYACGHHKQTQFSMIGNDIIRITSHQVLRKHLSGYAILRK